MPNLILKRETVKALIYDEESKKFLLVRFLFSKSPGGYGFVGGGIKKNENINDAILREVKEEIGLEPAAIKKIIQLEGEYVSEQKFLFFVLKNKIRMFLVFLNKTPKIRLNWELNDYIWTRFGDINKFLSSYYRGFLNESVQKNGNLFREI